MSLFIGSSGFHWTVPLCLVFINLSCFHHMVPQVSFFFSVIQYCHHAATQDPIISYSLFSSCGNTKSYYQLFIVFIMWQHKMLFIVFIMQQHKILVMAPNLWCFPLLIYINSSKIGQVLLCAWIIGKKW